MNDLDYIYPARSCFHTFGDDSCLIVAIYRDTIEIKKYNTNDILAIDIKGNHAFISVNYLLYVFTATNLSNEDLHNLIDYANQNQIKLNISQ